MRVIVTGSRKWSNAQAVYDELWAAYRKYGPFVLVHGSCSTGADAWAHHWYEMVGSQMGCEEKPYPANWDYWRERGNVKAAGPTRNARMVADGADLVLAFPLPEGSGTQHTIRLAEEAGIEVRRFEP